MIHGVLLSCRLHRLVRTCICGHFELGQPMPKALLPPLLTAFSLIKTVTAAFDAQNTWITTTCMHAVRWRVSTPRHVTAHGLSV